MHTMYTLADIDRASLNGSVTLVRVDFNVPLDGEKVLDDTRIRAALPTIEELAGAGARIALMSHCGRPKGQPNPEYSLRPAARALGELLGGEVQFADDCIGSPAEAAIADLAPGEVCLLENLRFHPGETDNDAAFADALAALGQVYVNDAFGTAHRAHASVVGVPERLERRAAGHLLLSETRALSRLLSEPERPFVAVIGGAKIDSKVGTVRNLLPRLDSLVLGGGMANTFLAAQGHDTAASLVESDKVAVADEILSEAARRDIRVILPVDLVVAESLERTETARTVTANAIPNGSMALDIGEETRVLAADEIGRAQTVLWNGPMGVFETPPFDSGTLAIARALAECPGYTVIGGGETVAAANAAGVAERLGHVSTGGGASLEFLAGQILPGVAVLEKQP